MEITKALVADYANVADGGKLNVLGIFSTIFSRSFPTVHPAMQLIFMWEASKIEAGRKKEIEMQLCDADGKVILSLGGEFQLPEGISGKRIYGNQILPLNNLKFEKPG